MLKTEKLYGVFLTYKELVKEVTKFQSLRKDTSSNYTMQQKAINKIIILLQLRKKMYNFASDRKTFYPR